MTTDIKSKEGDSLFDAEKINTQIEKLEYAKQQAIEFSEFIDSKGLRRERGRKNKQRIYGEWYAPAAGYGGGEPTTYTTEQLYNLFLQSKQQNINQ